MEQMQPQVQGIIPAYAGSTKSLRFEHVRDFRIIPAYAGSTAPGSAIADGILGSSPHTRGAHLDSNTDGDCSKDHPRIRGEHRPRHLEDQNPVGIIPAYAGSTPFDG